MCWGHSPLGFSGSGAQIPLQLSLSLTIQIMNFHYSIFKLESIKKIICQPHIKFPSKQKILEVCKYTYFRSDQLLDKLYNSVHATMINMIDLFFPHVMMFIED